MTAIHKGPSLGDTCRRYEAALENFGRSCFDLLANEAAFQAWYAASVMQEFGLTRVYREIIFDREHLLAAPGTGEVAAFVTSKSELRPDLCVSWYPGVDARHHSTRNGGTAAELLARMAVVTELKVTASTKDDIGWAPLRKDLAKLGIFAAAAASSPTGAELATYLVVLDNRAQPAERGRPFGDYPDELITDDEVLGVVRASWPAGIPLATLAVLRREGATFYRGLSRPT